MFRRILLWFGGMLIFSFFAFLITSYWLHPRARMRDDMMRRTVRFQFDEAVRAFQTGGAKELAAYLERLDTQFRAHHRLLDSKGRDLVTGEDRSAQVKESESPPRFTLRPPPYFLFRLNSQDNGYIFLVRLELRGDPWTDLAMYGWIVLVIALLCYALAWTLARPIRQLRDTVVRFGRGELAVRSGFQRNDEIGELGRAFDEMAGRIETLLTAERRLLQDISHELRSPLARLRFASELAKSSGNPQAAFTRVNREVDRLSTLVGELIQMTRAEGEAESRNNAAIEMAEFLTSIVEDCRIEAEARGCRLELNAREPVTWTGDRELIHRAIENVLRNAIRYAPSGTAVEIDLRATTEQVAIRVRDHGPGVPEADLERIFRPFYRVEEDRSRDNGSAGVGLGLSIAQRALRLHHGSIHARNANPGLEVELILPR